MDATQNVSIPGPRAPRRALAAGRSSIGRLLYWLPVAVPLGLFAQIALLGLRPALLERVHIGHMRAELETRHAADLALADELGARHAARLDPIFRERQRRGGPRPLDVALAALALALLPSAGQAASHADQAEPRPAAEAPPWAEGPALENDAFLPTSTAARGRIIAGDLAWAARVSGAADAGAVEAFEAWHAALAESEVGEAVPERAFPPGPLGPPGAEEERVARSVEGVEYAVLRRLAALDEGARRAFRARFERLAENALAAALAAGLAPARLARVEREHPATPPSARAALLLFDQAFEEARAGRAAAWLERAERHAELGAFADAEPWRSALAARRAALAPALAAGAGEDEPWRSARALEMEASIALDAGDDPGPRSRLRPGAVLLADGRIVVQAGDAVYAVDPGDLPPVAFALSRMLQELGLPCERPFGLPDGDWPLLPASDGARVVLVAGRGDALVCVDPPRPGALARLRWALSDSGLAGPDGLAAGPGELLEEGLWDFQPGPVVSAGQVFVQARHWPASGAGGSQRARRRGKPRAVLLALELETGRPAWSAFLAIGADIGPEASLRDQAVDFGVHAMPLALAGGELFAGTHLGVGSLVDALDGRLAWSFLCHRRDAQAAGWSAGGPPPVSGPCAAGADGSSGLLWAPADSDFLYWMRATPALDAAGLQLQPPEPVGAALELVGGDRCAAIVQARSGARRGLASWDAASGERVLAPWLGREETFQGAGLASRRRVLFTTDRGLYLLDRERDLYLLGHVPLPLPRGARGPAGGSVFASGERVVVVGSEALWLLRASG